MPVFIVEGEKDTNALNRRGYAAFCCGGANDWNPEIAGIVRNANVIILADNDDAGVSSANAILHDVQNVAKSARIIVPMPDIPKADISDYFQAGHSKQEFEQMINSVTEKRADVVSQKGKSLETILKEMHAEHYETTDKGFGRLFAEVFKNQHSPHTGQVHLTAICQTSGRSIPRHRGNKKFILQDCFKNQLVGTIV